VKHADLALGLAGVLVAAGSAAAQTPASPARAKELSAGVVWAGPLSFGSANADLIRPDGSSLTLFETKNSLGPGFGVRAGLAFEVRRGLWVEVVPGWTRASLRTEIGRDAENADIGPIRARVMRFSIEGAALYYFRVRGKTAWFARGGGGWAKELADGNALAEDAVTGSGGLGLRHWWREGQRGKTKSLGLRAEFRLDLRRGGLTLAERGWRAAPAAVGHLIVGF